MTFYNAAGAPWQKVMVDEDKLLSGNFAHYTRQVYKNLDGGSPSGPYGTSYHDVRECCNCQQRMLQAIHVQL